MRSQVAKRSKSATAVTSTTTVGALTVDSEGGRIRVSRAGAQVLGLDCDEEHSLRSVASQFIPDDRRRLLAAIRWAEDAEMECRLQVRLIRPEKNIIDVRAAAVDPELGLKGVLVTVRDLTPRFCTLPLSRSREEMLAEVLSAAHIGTWELSVAARLMFFSEPAYAVLELPPAESVSQEAFMDILEESGRDAFEDAISRSIRDQSPFDLELPIRTPAGNQRWLRAVGEVAQENGISTSLIGVLEDITLRRQGEEDFRVEAERWALALAGSDAGVWDWNLKTGAIAFSPAWKRLLGFEPHEFENQVEVWQARLHPDDYERATAAIDAHLRGESQSFELEHRLRHRDGEYRWFLGKGRVTARDEKGEPARFTGTIADVTNEVQLREALTHAMKVAQAAATAKSEFLAHMSHEIRTPLNAILGTGQLLLTEDLDEDLADQVDTIVRSGDILLELINDILDHAKLESGHIEVESVPFDLSGLIDDVVMIQRPRAEAGGVELLATKVPAELDCVMGDPVRIRQILINYVGNAIKFTEEGQVRIAVIIEDRGTESRRVRIEVQDDGIGIDADGLERLFQAFSQADASTTRRFGGTGLGLCISRQLAKAMQGEVGVESELGKGSTFWVSLPLPSAACDAVERIRAERDKAAPAASRRRARPRVLVAEDNEVNQRVARRILAKLDCDVVVANHGREAVELRKREPVDIVLMDCQMPEMDGYEATSEIRAWEEEQGQRIPIVALTANALAEVRERCMAVGMDDYLAKPFRIPELERLLAKHCR